jgi:hypothetical protein
MVRSRLGDAIAATFMKAGSLDYAIAPGIKTQYVIRANGILRSLVLWHRESIYVLQWADRAVLPTRELAALGAMTRSDEQY